MGIFNYNSERLNKYSLINLSEVVALKMAKRITGSGYHFNTENKTIREMLQKLEKWNDFDTIFFSGEKILSAYGFLIPTWDRSIKGEMFCNMGNAYGNSQVAKINYSVELAVVWMRDGTDSTGRYLRTTYTKDKVIRHFMSNLDTANIMGESDKILKAKQLPAEETHNLGFVPVSFFQNLPKKNMYAGNVVGEWYPDSTPVKGIQELFDFLYCIITKEAEFNRTRVFADITSTEMNQILTQLSSSLGDNGDTSYATKLKSLIGDFIIASNLRPIEGGSGKAIEVIQGDPKFDKYVELLNALKDWYIWGCGLSPKDDTEGTKTTLEVRATSQEEDLTIRTKKTLRQKQWKHHFDKVLMYMGLSEEALDDYSLEFKDTSMKDSIQELENEQFKMDNGLSSKIMSTMKIEGLNREQAIQRLEQIEQDNQLFPIDLMNNEIEEVEEEKQDEPSNSEELPNKKPNFIEKVKNIFKKDK